MTSVPKPFKLLQPHYAPLVARLGTYAGTAPTKCVACPWPQRQCAQLPAVHARRSPGRRPPRRALFADVLSVLSMTMGTAGERSTLKYKLLGDRSDIGDWGSEYVRSLSGEIGDEYKARVQPPTPADGTAAPAPQPVEDLLGLIRTIIPYDMKHNAEVDVRVAAAARSRRRRRASTMPLASRGSRPTRRPWICAWRRSSCRCCCRRASWTTRHTLACASTSQSAPVRRCAAER